MAGVIQLTGPAQEIVEKFGRLTPAVRGGIVRSLRGAMLAVEDQVRRRANVQWRRGGSGLSGRLTSYAQLGGKLGIDAAVGFRKTRGFPYELSQEFGAKASGGKALAIPLDSKARKISEMGQGPRSYPGKLVLIKTAQHVLLFPMGKRHIRQQPAYVLVKSIPPRLHFMENVRNNLGLIERGIVDGARAGLATEAKG